MIQFLERKQIDLQKWDAAVRADLSGLPYALSGYLDMVTRRQWSGLVLNDYQVVMPLPWNRKWFGFRQVYQPLLTQQLGLFGASEDRTLLPLFLNHLPTFFVKVMTPVKGTSIPENTIGEFHLRTNLILPLNWPYADIRAGYRKNLRNEINKAGRWNSLFINNQTTEHLHFCFDQLQNKVRFSTTQKGRMQALLEYLIQQERGQIYQARDSNGKVLATAFFAKTDRRIINLLSTSSAAGRAHFSMHFLLDQIIQRHAGQALLLDFEGSEIPGVARFFKSFGAVPEPYMLYTHNRLPGWLVRLREGIGKVG